MKKILLFLLLTLPVLLYAQYPTTGNKQRLGWQTTGDGLVYRAAGLPSYTPTTLNNAYTYIDTSTGRVYRYSNGAWRDLSSEKYIRKIDETILASPVKDSLSIHDWFFIAMELTSGATSDKAVQLPVTGLDSTYAGRIVRVSALDSSATYNVSVVSSSPDGIAIGDSLTTSYTLQNGETAELQLYVFDTIYQWRITFRRSFELPADNVTGNGTTNFLPLWIAPYTLGTAGISDDGSEIQFARPTVLYGVNTAAPATYGTFGTDNTLGIERPTYYNGSAWIPWLAYSGGTNQYSYFSNSNTITSGTQLFRSATGVEIGDGNYFKLPSNSTVGSMLGSTAGRMEFNNTAQNLSFRTSTATEYPVKSAYSTGLFTATRVPYADANGRLTDNSNFKFSGVTVSAPIFSSSNYILIQSSGPGLYFRRATSQRWFFLVAGSVGAQYYSPYGYGVGDFLISNEATSASDIWDIVYFKRKFASTNMRSPRIWQESYYTTTTTGVAESYGWGVQRTASSKNQNYYSLFYRRDSTQQWDNGSQFAVQSPTEIFKVSPSGQVRIIDLTPTPTRVIGADADGDLGQITLGSNLSLTSGTLNVTGTYTGFTPAADSGTGSNVASGGTLTISGGFGVNTSVSSTTVTMEVDTGQVATQYDLTQFSTPTHAIARTIYDGDAALPDSTVAINGTFNAGFWRVPESMDGYTLTKASFGIFDKGDMSTSGATYSFGVQKCNGSNMSCSNSSNVNFTPSSETELELSISITLNANDILRVNYQPPQGCVGGCGTENVNGLVVTYTIQQN